MDQSPVLRSGAQFPDFFRDPIISALVLAMVLLDLKLNFNNGGSSWDPNQK
jgi:hypothetical protein